MRAECSGSGATVGPDRLRQRPGLESDRTRTQIAFEPIGARGGGEDRGQRPYPAGAGRIVGEVRGGELLGDQGEHRQRGDWVHALLTLAATVESGSSSASTSAANVLRSARVSWVYGA